MGDEKKRLVCKSNHLVEASYRLSLYEQRLVLTAITQVRRDQPVTDEQIYFVSAADVAQQSGVDVNAAYKYTRRAMQRLFERKLTATVLDESAAGDGEVKKGRKRTFRWIQTMEEDVPAGLVGIRFSKEILPYLSQLKEQFTQYALADVGKMTSVYGIRLYELLVQWKSRGSRTVSIEWLRTAFDLGDRHKALSDFKKVVINPAIQQVNDHSPLVVRCSQKKTGRKVTHFTFTFEKKSDRQKKLERQQREAKRQQQKLEQQAAKDLAWQRDLMRSKPPWMDAEHPIEPGETKAAYFQRIAKIRGLDQPKSKPAAVATDSAAADQSRCTNTPDMFEAFEGDAK